MSGDNEKPPLEYRNYSDDRPERKQNIGVFVTGMVAGVILVAVCGFVDALGHLNIGGAPPPPVNHLNLSVCIFGSVAATTALLGTIFLRGPRRRFMLAGFLLGVALCCSIEGICFFG